MRVLRWVGHGTGKCFLSLPLCRPALKARQESGRCAEPNKPIQPWRGEMSETAVSDTLHSPVKGPKGEKWSLSWTNTSIH